MPDNIHQDKPTQLTEAVFHGMNGVDAPHIIEQDEVQTSTNIDFTLEYGAASVRRGSIENIAIAAAGTANPPNLLRVEFPNMNFGINAAKDGCMYVGIGNVLYRNNNGTAVAISTASGSFATWEVVTYKAFTYAMGGDGVSGPGVTVKDDGTNVTDWINQVPATAPTVVVNTLTANLIQGTLTASEGTLTSGTIVKSDPITFRADVEQAVTTNILATNGTHTIGDYGIISVQISVTEPKNITRVSMDFGIGTSFSDYYHIELNATDFDSGYPDPNVLIQSQQNLPTYVQGTTTISNSPLTQDTKNQMIQNARLKSRPAVSQLSVARNTFNTWLCPKTKFSTIFRKPNPGEWANVGTARIVIEGTGTFTATITNWQIAGASDFSLNDINVGYTWWETFAQIDANSGNILGESAPSPMSTATKIQNVNATVTGATAPTGSSGVTHRIFYRQGGFLNAPYAVGTVAIATSSLVDTMTDMDALSLNLPMLTNITSSAGLGDGCLALAAYYDRIFAIINRSYDKRANVLAWSLPGRPDAFPRTSYAEVGEASDIGQALIAWYPWLIIISDHNVYQMVGNYFEGPQQDWTIARTGAKHGCKSRRVCIPTPYGIPLLDFDGLYMYQPGAGVDEPLDWVMAKIGDMWRGTSAGDPAAIKGNRLPAINFTNIGVSCAAYMDNRLYIGVPCEASPPITRCSHMIVIDFKYKKVFLYTFPFKWSNMTWDWYHNQLFVLTTQGNVMQIETGLQDVLDGGGASGISWIWKTRSWAVPTEVLTENIALQYRGGTGTCLAIYDQTNTVTVATLTNSAKVWSVPALGGTIANDIVFQFQGTQSGVQNTIFQLQWDNWLQPKRTAYYRTDYDDAGTEKEKIYDVHYTDIQVIGSSTVLATAFIDNVAISTFTLSGYDEKKRYEFAYPAETYGNIEYTIYNAVSTGTFKLYGHHNDVRIEPPRITIFDSDRVSGGEQWWRQITADVNPLGGTVTAVFYLDEVPQGTFTLLPGTSGTAGTGRQIFPFALHTATDSIELYGKVAYTRYTSTTPFKHYRTWYHTEATPDRLTQHQSSYLDMPSEGVVKTWLVELQIFGTSSVPAVVGTVFLDNVAVTSATFTGATRHIYETALPNITVGKSLKAVYNAKNTGDVFKHWRTDFEVQPKPFYKTQWVTIYRKPTAITQCDQLRFYQLDMETAADPGVGTNTATLTSTWFIDGTAFCSNTYVLAAGTRTYIDRISFPPGGFGYLFQQLMSSDQPFHLWSSSLDAEHIGVKGFARTIHIPGTPQDQQDAKPAMGQIEERPRNYQGY